MDFTVFKLFLHLCSISLPFDYLFIFLIYCFFGLLFPGFKVESFLHFCFCPPNFGPVICVNFVQGEIGAESLVVVVVFPLMGKAE